MRIPTTGQALRSPLVQPQIAQTQRGLGELMASVGSRALKAARDGLSDFTPAGGAPSSSCGERAPKARLPTDIDWQSPPLPGTAPAFQGAAEALKDLLNPRLPTEINWQSPPLIP